MTAELSNILSTAKIYDLMFNTETKTDNGWKLSIQGKSLDDVIFLYDRLSDYLFDNKIPFKIATNKRIISSNKEQSQKVMTIYVPDYIDVYEFAETIYSKIIDYKGWYNIKTPTNYEFYAGGVYIRNDRDEYGDYIPAK
jgi:hypothetical protein